MPPRAFPQRPAAAPFPPRGRRWRILLGLGVCLALLPAPGEGDTREIRFTPMPGGERLSHRSVFAIAEDRAGFLWFGTSDGLDRYDGYDVVAYRAPASGGRAVAGGLPSSVVYALRLDSRGELWVGTEAGLCRTAGDGRFAVYDPRQVRNILETRAGELWVSTAGGLLRFDRATDAFVPLTDPVLRGDLAGMAEDGHGNLWVVAPGNPSQPSRLVRVGEDGRALDTLALVGRPWGRVWSVHRDALDRLWLDAEGPLLRDGAQLRHPAAATGPAAACFLRDRRGWLWAGGAGSGLFLTRGDEAPARVRGAPFDTSWLHGHVLALHEDRSGTVWAGTLAGAYRFDPHAPAFRHLRHDPQDPRSLSTNAVSAVAGAGYAAARAEVWVGTFGGGLNRLLPDATFERFRHRAGDPGALCDDLIWALHGDALGRLWIGAESGLCGYDAERHLFRRHPLPFPRQLRGAERVMAIAGSADGELWLGTLDGLYRYDPASGRGERFPFTGSSDGPSSSHVLAALADGNLLWLGSGGGVLNRFAPATRSFRWYGEPAAPRPLGLAGSLFDLHRDDEGTLWLATSEGLVRFDPRRETFARVEAGENLPRAIVYSVRADRDGRLWLGTSQGLVRFDPRAAREARFRRFERADGVGSVEFNRHAAYAAPDGTLYFGGLDGLTFFRPEEIRDNSYAPPVVLTRVETSGRGQTTAWEPTGLARLRLSHRDATLALEFAALAFTNPERNHYAYRMEGLDPEWIAAGTRRYARYTNLPPGRYIFRVRGSNDAGVFGASEVALPITVTPPLWATWWFRAALVLLLAAALFAAYRMRVARLLAVERLRLAIASDLHDDLASDLGGIVVVSDLLRQDSGLAAAQRGELAGLRDTALRMADALRDIVWTISPEHDTLEALARKMRGVAETLLRGLEVVFEVALAHPGRPLEMKARRDLLLVFKELLHNVVRHAHARGVAIAVRQEGDELRLAVRDDGAGFDPAAAAAGTGLGSLRRRAERLGGRIEIASRPGEGTAVTLAVPLPRTRGGGRGGRGSRLRGGDEPANRA